MATKNQGALKLPSLQRSVKKLSGKKLSGNSAANRAASQQDTEASASPLVNNKRKRNTELDDEEGSPAGKRMATDQAVMEALARLEKKFDTANERLWDCAQKDDLTAIEVSIRDKVRDNERRLNRMEAEMGRTAKNVQKLVEECVDARMSQRIVEVSRSCAAESDVDKIDRIEKRDFIESRKSIKMWPVKGEGDELMPACRHFLKTALAVPVDIADSIEVASIRKIGQARRSKIKDEVLVKFSTIEDRDLIQSYASNLSRLNGEAGIRLDFPSHLRNVFRLLETHGSLLKKSFKDLKRSIKFDDAAMSLVMDVKLTPEDDWERIDEKGARASKREREVRNSGGETGRANPGGAAGRRALMMSSPQQAFTRSDGQPDEGSERSWSSRSVSTQD